jgi:hypothetical protein
MSVVGALIEITGGNVRNDHFYLRDAQFLFPASVVGGSNSDDQADDELTVEFVPGLTVKTDIAGDKMILRNRSAVRDFFKKASVEEGDRVLVEVVDRLALRVSKISRLLVGGS